MASLTTSLYRIEKPQPRKQVAKPLLRSSQGITDSLPHEIRDGKNGKRRRDREILCLSRQGICRNEIARRMNLDISRIRLIVEELEGHEAINPLALYLSVRTMNALRRALGLFNPDFERFRTALKEDPQWREHILLIKGCGPAVVKEIEEFCQANSLKVWGE